MDNAHKRLFERNLTETYISNVLQVWEVAKSRQLTNTTWYSEAFNLLLDIAGEYNVTVENVAWVVATLSPHLSWYANVNSAYAFFDDWLGYAKQYPQTAYGTQVHKCELYMSGELSGLPTGRKVESFYRNLLGDKTSVTFDRHMYRICTQGARNIDAMSGDANIGTIEFRCGVAAIKYCAKLLCIEPSDLQSITWQVVCQ